MANTADQLFCSKRMSCSLLQQMSNDVEVKKKNYSKAHPNKIPVCGITNVFKKNCYQQCGKLDFKTSFQKAVELSEVLQIA